jgi:hypothetical protein
LELGGAGVGEGEQCDGGRFEIAEVDGRSSASRPTNLAAARE